MSLEKFKRPRLLDKNEEKGKKVVKKKAVKKAVGRSITKKKKK